MELYKGYQIKIEQDELDESPREWEPLGTMVCWHKNYELGDKHSYTRPLGEIGEGFYAELAYELDAELEGKVRRVMDRMNTIDHRWSETKARIDRMLWEVIYLNVVMLPLYTYEHGGITMNTTSFADPHDTSMVGFIFMKREEILEEYGWKHLTKIRREEIKERLKGEVATYDQYLTGDVWRYEISPDPDQEPEAGEIEMDSCGGFYGHEYCLEAAQEEITGHIHEHKKQRLARLKVLIKNQVSLNLRKAELENV
jgi:hypothetical protein